MYDFCNNYLWQKILTNRYLPLKKRKTGLRTNSDENEGLQILTSHVRPSVWVQRIDWWQFFLQPEAQKVLDTLLWTLTWKPKTHYWCCFKTLWYTERQYLLTLYGDIHIHRLPKGKRKRQTRVNIHFLIQRNKWLFTHMLRSLTSIKKSIVCQ